MPRNLALQLLENPAYIHFTEVLTKLQHVDQKNVSEDFKICVTGIIVVLLRKLFSEKVSFSSFQLLFSILKV